MRAGIVFPLLVMGLIAMLTLAVGCGGTSSPSGGSEAASSASDGGSSEQAAASSDQDASAMAADTEAMGYIPSSKAGDHIGQEATVRGVIKDYQWISGRSGRPHLLLFDTPAIVKRGSTISEQEIPDTFTVVVWREDALKPENNFPSTSNFGPNYLQKVVCVTGTIEKDWDDRPSITARSGDQLKVDC